MLPVVCRQFAEVYAQYEFDKLHAQVAELEFRLFMAELPSIGECTRRLNQNEIHCTCLVCAWAGRVDHDTSPTDMACKLGPAFMRVVLDACNAFPVQSDGSMCLPTCNPNCFDWRDMPWNVRVPKDRWAEWKRACTVIASKTYWTKADDSDGWWADSDADIIGGWPPPTDSDADANGGWPSATDSAASGSDGGS